MPKTSGVIHGRSAVIVSLAYARLTRSMQAMIETRKTGRTMRQSRARFSRAKSTFAACSIMIPPGKIERIKAFAENKKSVPLKGTDLISALPPKFRAKARRSDVLRYSIHDVPSYAAPVTGSSRGRLLLVQRHTSRMIFGFLLISGFHHTRLAMHQRGKLTLSCHRLFLM